MHTFQIGNLLVLTLVFSQICWICVINFFQKDNAFYLYYYFFFGERVSTYGVHS